GPCLMSTTTAPPATTPIPVQLSETEFEAFILPHLSMPKRGPKCKLVYHCVFNLILWVLYTGMQWKCLSIPTDAQGKPGLHYTNVYRVFAKRVDDGSLWQAFLASVRHLGPTEGKLRCYPVGCWREISIAVCPFRTGTSARKWSYGGPVGFRSA